MSQPRLDPPFSLEGWIGANLPESLGAIGNREVFKRSDFIFQIIKGPNARNDFHIDPWDEIFYQIHGHIFVHVIDAAGKERKLRIEEGAVFLLPKNVFHSPRRPPGSIGLVIERPRATGELDGVAWFCERCSAMLDKIDFHCADIETGIKDIVEAFNADEARRTCKQCRSVLPDPTKIRHWD